MVEEIMRDNYESLPNAAFRRYAKTHVDIQADFGKAVEQFGLCREPDKDAFCLKDLRRRAAHLAKLGTEVANDCKSIHAGWISPSCVACRKGVGTETFLASTQCPRNCYFCFNPNQEDYEYYRDHVHDMAAEFQQRYDAGLRHTDVAITGGEPLLHRSQTLVFWGTAHSGQRTGMPGCAGVGDAAGRAHGSALLQPGKQADRPGVSAEQVRAVARTRRAEHARGHLLRHSRTARRRTRPARTHAATHDARLVRLRHRPVARPAPPNNVRTARFVEALYLRNAFEFSMLEVPGATVFPLSFCCSAVRMRDVRSSGGLCCRDRQGRCGARKRKRFQGARRPC
ncbi:MAG TPA: hypothetical protein DCP91_02020 [Eggerthellaceae bacterium]|nr:hypothetical protein [Eggerthellaceae bacterium]